MATTDAPVLIGREPAIRDIAAESGFDRAADALERVVCEGPVDEEVIAAYRNRDVPIAPVYGRLECPTAMSGGFDTGWSGSDGDGAPVGRPVPGCQARLVDDEEETVLEGAAEGQLQLSGPMLAEGYVSASGSDDETRDEPAERDRTADGATDDRSRFTDGWFHTGERFSRDGTGLYRPQ